MSIPAIDISHGAMIARVRQDAPFYRGAVALLKGEGTRERPLHFVLLACHADMADDAPIARSDQTIHALADEVLARLEDERSRANDVVRELNAVAAATDRYYSIAAGRMTERNVEICAIGSVYVIVMTGPTRVSMISPHVIRIGQRAILDGAFGIGFKEAAMSDSQFELINDAGLLLVIGKEIGSIENTSKSVALPSIDDIVRSMPTPPPILAVVR